MTVRHDAIPRIDTARLVDSALDASIVLGFSRLGIAVRRRLDAPMWDEDLPSLDGKVALVTGGSSGLGQAAATGLARLGASVWILARDPEKAERAAGEIRDQSGHGDVHVVVADLTDLDSVREAAASFAAQVDRLDVLVHNAGMLLAERTETVDGNEATLQVHVIAPFLLTALLRPQLAAANGRVITVASGGLYSQPLAIDDLQNEQDYRGSVAYARAKRAQVLTSEEWARRLAPDGISVHVMHPGWADTPGVADSLPGFHKITAPVLRSPEEGADTVVWLAAAPAATVATGRFWSDRRPRPTHRVPWTRKGDRHRGELWERLCELADITPAEADPTGPNPN